MNLLSSIFFAVGGVAVYKIFENEGLAPGGPVGLLVLLLAVLLGAAYLREPIGAAD